MSQQRIEMNASNILYGCWVVCQHFKRLLWSCYFHAVIIKNMLILHSLIFFYFIYIFSISGIISHQTSHIVRSISLFFLMETRKKLLYLMNFCWKIILKFLLKFWRHSSDLWRRKSKIFLRNGVFEWIVFCRYSKPWME